MSTTSIIGTGTIGANLARNLSRTARTVVLFDEDRTVLEGLRAELRGSAARIELADSAVDAARRGDVVVLSVWHGVQLQLAPKLAAVTTGKIVVSVANPLNATFDGLTTPSDTSSAEQLAALLPDAHVMKAFNTVLAADFAATVQDGRQIDCFVAGDYSPAVETVSQLVEDAGFRAIVAGELATSQTLERMTLLLIGISQRYELGWSAGWRVLSNNFARVAAVALLVLSGFGESRAQKTAAAPPSAETSAYVAELRAQIAQHAAAEALVAQHLKTFDELDYEVFTKQEWDRLHESHGKDVRVFWPDGHLTVGLDVHVADLAKLFVYAPDTRIEYHPIKFGSGNLTAVTGVFEGTFTKPMPIGDGRFIQPTGKAFKMPMATIGIWANGIMVEEHLFWDNQTYAAQIGL